MKKRMIMLGTLMVLLSFSIYANEFDNLTYGIKITKPETWHFEKLENVVKSAVILNFKSINKILELGNYQPMPCVIITKYKEPYNSLNPSLRITPIIVPREEDIKPDVFVKKLLHEMPQYADGFEIEKVVYKQSIDTLNAYSIKYKYNFKIRDTNQSSLKILAGITMIFKENIAFMIQTVCSQDGEENTDSQFDQIIQSIDFY